MIRKDITKETVRDTSIFVRMCLGLSLIEFAALMGKFGFKRDKTWYSKFENNQTPLPVRCFFQYATLLKQVSYSQLMGMNPQIQLMVVI